MIKTIYDIPEHIFKTSYQNATIGHVLTPPKLALEMIETLPSDFIKSGIKILDPACKNGSFLFQLVIKKLDSEWTIKEIENSLYTCDTLNASLNIAESGIKHIIRFPYQNSLIKINNLLYKHIEIELLYDKLIKTITKNKYISIRQFINNLLLDRKNNWLILKFEENLIEFIKKYEGLSKTESKLFGEVFTPQALIEEMLDTLPDDVWSNKDLKWLDPAVGIGNFPAAVLGRLMDGLKYVIVDSDERRKWILEEMLYMGDISTKNLFLLYQLFDANNEFKLNVFRGDFLGGGFDKQILEWGLDGFDLVVGNPPYQTENNSTITKTSSNVKLWRIFIEKSLKILKKSGFLNFVTPSSWASGTKNPHNSTNLFNDIFNMKNTIFISFDVNHYFSKIGVDFSYYLIQNDSYKGLTKLKCDSIITEIDLSNFNLLPKIVNNKIFSILNKLSVDKFTFKMDRKDHYKGSLNISITDEFNIPVYCGPSKGILYSDKSSPYFKLPKIFTHRISSLKMLNDENCEISTNYSQVYILENGENGKYASELFETKFYKFLYKLFQYTQYNECITLNQLPKIDLSKSWTDKELYEYFNLTQEEIQLIEDTISDKKKKSKNK
jgi:site-specific DNA-methyltransferase (adenine-specific)